MPVERFAPDPNSTVNEMRWRLRDPKDFDGNSFKRWREWAGVKAPEGVSFIVGDIDGEKAIQAIRFDKSKFDQIKAEKFWQSIASKPGFEKKWTWDRSSTYIGTCGFNHASWKGEFYPEDIKENEKLLYYACHLPTVEINSTMHFVPRLDVFEKWAQQVPEDFVFSFRMVANRKLDEMSETLFRRAKQTISGQFGPICLVIPPNAKYSSGDIKRLFDELPAHKYALDIKSEEWLNTEVYNTVFSNNGTIVRDHLLGGELPSKWEYIRLPLYSAMRFAGIRTDLKAESDYIGMLPEEKTSTYFYVGDEAEGPDGKGAKPSAGTAKILLTKTRSKKPSKIIDLNVARRENDRSFGEMNPRSTSENSADDMDIGNPFLEKEKDAIKKYPKTPLTQDTSFIEGVDGNGGLTEPGPRVDKGY
jgi:hypothetical protein